jgi:hypothetical protein
MSHHRKDRSERWVVLQAVVDSRYASAVYEDMGSQIPNERFWRNQYELQRFYSRELEWAGGPPRERTGSRTGGRTE